MHTPRARARTYQQGRWRRSRLQAAAGHPGCSALPAALPLLLSWLLPGAPAKRSVRSSEALCPHSHRTRTPLPPMLLAAHPTASPALLQHRGGSCVHLHAHADTAGVQVWVLRGHAASSSSCAGSPPGCSRGWQAGRQGCRDARGRHRTRAEAGTGRETFNFDNKQLTAQQVRQGGYTVCVARLQA